MAISDIKIENVKSSVNANGRIVIPFRIRRALGLESGDIVSMTLKDGVLHIEPHQARVKRIQDELKKFAKPGSSASGLLAAERREEASAEMEEWLG